MLTFKNIFNFFFFFALLSSQSFKRIHGSRPRPKPKANKKKEMARPKQQKKIHP
jgi:hypothetical protein